MTTSDERMEELMLADEPEFQHVLECVFDVQRHESRTYFALLDAGGYVYQYTAVPPPEARERMHEAVEEWSARVHDRIDEFGWSG